MVKREMRRERGVRHGDEDGGYMGNRERLGNLE
jgi:hypothetical protein